MQKRWKISKPLSEELQKQKEHIVENIKCPEMIAEMLIRKELIEIDDIEEFFHPDLNNMHDPFLYKDMKKATERIKLAIDKKELITIYGDYDVDGTTSSALLYLGLKKIGANIS